MESSRQNEPRLRPVDGEVLDKEPVNPSADNADRDTQLGSAVEGYRQQQLERDIAEAVSEERAFYEAMGVRVSKRDTEGSVSELEALRRDAGERSKWSRPMAHAFIGAARLAAAVNRPRRRSPI